MFHGPSVRNWAWLELSCSALNGYCLGLRVYFSTKLRISVVLVMCKAHLVSSQPDSTSKTTQPCPGLHYTQSPFCASQPLTSWT